MKLIGILERTSSCGTFVNKITVKRGTLWKVPTTPRNTGSTT